MNAVLSPMGMNFFPEPEIDHKALITKRLSQTGREGMDELLSYMEDSGFFSAPCSGGHHLCVEGGLATHSWNVYQTALKLNETLGAGIPEDTLAVCSLLHDLGKTGDFGKEMYVQNVLKTGKVSASKPYKRNPTLSSVPHAIRFAKIAQRFIPLSEEEEWAILCHDGQYDFMRYELVGHETPLYMILHWADMWASRVIEMSDGEEEEAG